MSDLSPAEVVERLQAYLDRRTDALPQGTLTASIALIQSQAKRIEELEGARAAACWRRGMMHAVERIDLVIPPHKDVPKSRAFERIQAIRAALDELTEFQRSNVPANYREAFDLCKADYEAARLALPGGRG